MCSSQALNKIDIGLGNFPKIVSNYQCVQDINQVANIIDYTHALACQGNGRAYGDCALHPRTICSSLKLNQFESFDAQSGVLVAQAGVLLSDILNVFMPKGFFLAVTPGTKFVTIGGAVASDVHGKDHHITGTFSSQVLFIDIFTAEQGLVRASRTEYSDLFFATIGGMGLTGFIVKVALKLKPIPSAMIQQSTYKCANLSEIMQCFTEHQDLPYSVAWIDCLNGSKKSLGRSLFMAGDFAQQEQLPERYQHPHLSKTYNSNTSNYQELLASPLRYPQSRSKQVPFTFPSWILNNLSMRLFNTLYYHKAVRSVSTQLVSTDTFFYPLDALLNWNRIYGVRGFTQYQFVVPKDHAQEVITSILKQIAQSHKGSFLSVLKLFGEHNHPQANQTTNTVSTTTENTTAKSEIERSSGGYLSFPMSGYTLALDFAIEPDLFPLLERLDAQVQEAGGRIYLAKDSRLAATRFRAMYSNEIDQFLRIKAKYDPLNKFTSLQAQRLGLQV